MATKTENQQATVAAPANLETFDWNAFENDSAACSYR